MSSAFFVGVFFGRFVEMGGNDDGSESRERTFEH